jgi:hypothetical protein
VLAPVAEPDGVVARAWVNAPDALWAHLQNGVSGALGLMPPNVDGLLAAALSLEPAMAPHVDGQGTAFVVVASDPKTALGVAWTVALPMKDPDRALPLLVARPDAGAPFTARAVDDIGVLTPVGRRLPFAFAYAPGWWLLGSDEAAVLKLGPYAHRTMPTLQAPEGTASVKAIVAHDALAARLAAAWTEARAFLSDQDREQRMRHNGRPPDLGDPFAILEAMDPVVKRRVDLLAKARATTLTLDAGDDDVRMELRIEPADDDASAPGASGDAAPLAALPADSALALLVRDTPSARADDARELSAAIAKMLGPRVKAADDQAVGDAEDAWAAARGDWLAVALAGGARRAVTLRSPGGEGASKALRGLVDLAARPAVSALLDRSFDLGHLAVAPAHVDGVTDASMATFGKDGPLSIAWGLSGGELVAAADVHADKRLAEATSGARLGDDARVSRVLDATASGASLVVLAQPLRIDPARATSDSARAPAVVAWGRTSDAAWLEADVADELLREVVRMQIGL